jgi:hypothetical protein
MSFQTFVTERLAAITATINAIATNAKKIDELPVQENLNPASKIHVSRGGISESLEVQKIIDAVASGSYDQLLAIGEITLAGNVATIPANAQWKIDEVYYGNIANIVRTIPYCATGLARKDILVANTSNDIVLVKGPETAGITIRPNIPINTVFVTEMDITDNSVGTPTPPVISDAYVPKMESQDFAVNYGATTIIEQINLTDERSSISLTGSATDVKSVQVSGQFVRPGKPHFFKNRTGHNVKLWHLAGTGNIKYFFPNGLDLIVKNGEVITFNTNANDSGNVRFEYVGNYSDSSNYYTKTEVDIADTNTLNSAKTYADGLVVGLLDDRGNYNPSTNSNLYPTTGGSGVSGAILKGDLWSINGLGSGVSASIGGKTVTDGDVIRALVNTPGNTDANWVITENNFSYVAENSTNKTNTISGNETSTTLYSSIKGIVDWLTTAKIKSILGQASTSVSGWLSSTDWNMFNNKQDALVSGTNIKTVNGVTLLGSGNLVTPDMDTTTAQTVLEVKTFLNGKLGLRNVANTFTSIFTNTATTARTWTLPDKSGTVAMTSDIIAQLSGVVNYMVKFGTTTTGVVSRLFDTGRYFGIGTIYTPTKDMTFGYQTGRVIGVEDGVSTFNGSSLTIAAGRAINFDPSGGNYNPLFQVVRKWYGIAMTPNGDVYSIVNGATGGDIYKQTGGANDFNPLTVSGTQYSNISSNTVTGDLYYILNVGNGNGGVYRATSGTLTFSNVGLSNGSYRGICIALNGDVYVGGSRVNYAGGGVSGDIYKQTGGTGSFVALGQVTRDWGALGFAPNGDIYAADGFYPFTGGIYKQTAGVGNFISLAQTNRSWSGIASTSNGDVYACAVNGGIYKQTAGVGNFIDIGQPIRAYVGLTISSVGNIYVAVENGDIYMSNANSLGLPDLDGGFMIHKAGAGKGAGKSRWQVITGQKTTSGTNMQVETLRMEIDENGYLKRIGTPVYADNTTALAGGLTAGMEYRTSTGIKMEVY